MYTYNYIKQRFLLKSIACEQATCYYEYIQSGDPSITDNCLNAKWDVKKVSIDASDVAFTKRQRDPHAKQLMPILSWVYTISHFGINFL